MDMPVTLKRFIDENPGVYKGISEYELKQLIRIYNFYPDSVRLLRDEDAVQALHFKCKMCGECCSSVKFITVSYRDVKRWLGHNRWDILSGLTIDKRKTPLLASLKKEDIMSSKINAEKMLNGCPVNDNELIEHCFKLLYITDLLENAVYVSRLNNRCIFLSENDKGNSICMIHETKPEVCEKFPYYTGRLVDKRLLESIGFCPALKQLKNTGQAGDHGAE
jgi:Fe-S-cluster containining protein